MMTSFVSFLVPDQPLTRRLSKGMSEGQVSISNDPIDGVDQCRKAKPLVDSQFSPYLQNNDLPSPNILDAIVASKSEPLMGLQLVQRDIQALGLVLNALQKRRDYFEDLLSVYDSILAPIRRLPDETLEEIFYHCIPTTRNARPFVSESPLLLTLVCKKWRRISLAAPRLWTTLHIPLVFNYGPMSAYFNPYFQEPSILKPLPPSEAIVLGLQKARSIGLDQWLNRSGTLPISLSLHSPSTMPTSSHSDPNSAHASMQRETFSLFARYSDRLSDLEMTIPDHVWGGLGKFIQSHLGPKRFPCLRKLRVSSSAVYPAHYGASPTNFSLFLDTESLREISIQLPMGDVQRATESLSCNITVLTLHSSVDASFAQRIFCNCPQLARCHIAVNGRNFRVVGYPADPSISNPSDGKTIWMPALQTLSISGSLGSIQAACEVLETPLLSNFQLYVSEPVAPVITPTYDDELEQETDLSYPPPSTLNLCLFLSQCTSLHSLTIQPTYIRAAEIQAILSNVPQVKDLVLDNNFSGHPGIPIAIEKDGPGRSPCLSSLQYHLHPLLIQERPSMMTGEGIPIEEPLLPCLTSLTWNQFSHNLIPDNLLIGFINSRLSPPIDTNTDLKKQISHHHQSIAPLKNIKIRVLFEANANGLEAGIARHAESSGLKRGIDFSLDVSVYPWVKRHLTPVPQYVVPKVSLDMSPVHLSQDNLMVEYDVTWPFIDI